jgi:hypothetical protein
VLAKTLRTPNAKRRRTVNGERRTLNVRRLPTKKIDESVAEPIVAVPIADSAISHVG